MNTYNINEVKDSVFFSEDVYLDKKFLLSTNNVPFSAELKSMLAEWGFSTIYSEGIIIPQSLYSLRKKAEGKSSSNSNEMSRAMDNLKKQHEMMENVEKKFLSFFSFINKIYTDYSDEKRIDVRGVSDKAKELYEFVKSGKKLILRIKTEKYKDGKNYIVLHALRSTIFSIIIGIHLKLPAHKIIELSASCMLHEIGMIKLPSKIYMDNEPLGDKEKTALKTHPFISYKIVKNASFSLPVCLGVLEHHERENGSGYPRKLKSERISLYGKIIAVACSFEAAISDRPYKKAKNASAGIMDIIRNTNKQYDESILKALLYSMSFYPIGTYVKLSTGKIGQVIDTNPYDPRFPIVQAYEELSQNGEPKIIGTAPDGIKIRRALTRQEMKEMNIIN